MSSGVSDETVLSVYSNKILDKFGESKAKRKRNVDW